MDFGFFKFYFLIQYIFYLFLAFIHLNYFSRSFGIII